MTFVVEFAGWILWLALSTLLPGHRIVVASIAREYYGGICELRVIELQIDETWYETEPVRCEPLRRRR